MTRDEIVAQRKKIDAWRKTEIGALFEKYDAALGHAWVTDTTSQSPAKMKAEWKKADTAKAAFLDKVCELADIENPYA